MSVRSEISRLYSLLYFLQIPMAASSALFVWTCAVLTGRQLAWPWYVAAFAGTWAIYIHDAASVLSQEDRINAPVRQLLFVKNPWIGRWPPMLALLVAGVAIFIAAPSERMDLLLALLAFAGGLYTLTLIPSSRGMLRLKDLGHVKAWAVSLAWLVGGMGIPRVAGVQYAPPSAPIALIALFLFMLLMIDTVALDWRDVYGDRERGISTLAVVLGDATPRVLQIALIFTLAIWLAGFAIVPDPRWLFAGGMMAFTLAVPIFWIRSIRGKVMFGSLILLWRITGPLALLTLAKK